MITQLEIAIQSTYDTNTGSGPIASGLNWECATRLNKIGTFSFEMPLADSKRSLLVAKRYVRCYGIVNDTWMEQGKPGIIEKIARTIDGEGIPTGMIRVEGTDLLGELADILIHELDIIDTDTRIPDAVQYYDGTPPAYVGAADVAKMHDNNDGTSYDIPADDEDWFYIGDADPFDIVTFDLGAKLNSDTNNFTVQYSQGGASWGSGTILSDTTKVDNASFAQDGSIRWERQEDWATDTVNSVANMYWLRFRYREDMSGDVTVIEIDITQETPTATALVDWRDYTDVDGNNPLTDLGWSLDAGFYTATQNTVFLKLREVSAFKALAMIAEQTGENFRLGSGREIEWLQDDKTASGIVATNAIDATAGASATTNCWITSFRQSSDAYELVGRIYPRGGGRGATRVNLLECTRTAAGGYTLHKARNYLQKDSVESDYGRPIERPKYWPELMSPNAANAKDINVANALYDLTYQYLQRHCIPQTAYDIEVVKLDSAVAVGTTLQVAYWQTVDGSAIMDVGVDGTAVHLWVLESTQRVDNKGLRSVAMKIATTDAWPTSAGGKMQEVVYQVLAIQATDGPTSAASLTAASVADLLDSLDLSAYTKSATDETISGTWNFDANLGIGTPTPLVIGAYTYPAGTHLNVKNVTGRARITIQGAATAGAALNIIDLDANADDRWMQLVTYRGETWFRSWHDDLQTLVQDDILVMDLGTGDVTIGAGDLILDADLKLANGSVIGIVGNEIITFQAGGTIDFTGADVTMDADLTVSAGLNVGTVTGAGAGEGFFSGKILLANNIGYEQVDDGATTRLLLNTEADGTVKLYGYHATEMIVGVNGRTYFDVSGGAAAGGVCPRHDETIPLGVDAFEWKEVWALDQTINHSDMSKKWDVQSESLGLDFIRKLRPVGFRWKGRERLHHGLIGDEVAVTLAAMGIPTSEFAGYIWSENTKQHHLRYGEFIGPTIKAVQQLDSYRVNADAEREAIRARLDSIERRG